MFYICEMLEQAKLIYGGKRIVVAFIGVEVGMDWERAWAKLLSLSTVFEIHPCWRMCQYFCAVCTK